MAFVCKHCGGDRFYTVERLYGTAPLLEGATPDDYDWAGETKVDWDSSVTVGYGCSSCHSQMEFLDELIHESTTPKEV